MQTEGSDRGMCPPARALPPSLPALTLVSPPPPDIATTTPSLTTPPPIRSRSTDVASPASGLLGASTSIRSTLMTSVNTMPPHHVPRLTDAFPTHVSGAGSGTGPAGLGFSGSGSGTACRSASTTTAPALAHSVTTVPLQSLSTVPLHHHVFSPPALISSIGSGALPSSQHSVSQRSVSRHDLPELAESWSESSPSPGQACFRGTSSIGSHSRPARPVSLIPIVGRSQSESPSRVARNCISDAAVAELDRTSPRRAHSSVEEHHDPAQAGRSGEPLSQPRSVSRRRRSSHNQGQQYSHFPGTQKRSSLLSFRENPSSPSMDFAPHDNDTVGSPLLTVMSPPPHHGTTPPPCGSLPALAQSSGRFLMESRSRTGSSSRLLSMSVGVESFPRTATSALDLRLDTRTEAFGHGSMSRSVSSQSCVNGPSSQSVPRTLPMLPQRPVATHTIGVLPPWTSTVSPSPNRPNNTQRNVDQSTTATGSQFDEHVIPSGPPTALDRTVFTTSGGSVVLQRPDDDDEDDGGNDNEPVTSAESRTVAPETSGPLACDEVEHKRHDDARPPVKDPSLSPRTCGRPPLPDSDKMFLRRFSGGSSSTAGSCADSFLTQFESSLAKGPLGLQSGSSSVTVVRRGQECGRDERDSTTSQSLLQDQQSPPPPLGDIVDQTRRLSDRTIATPVASSDGCVSLLPHPRVVDEPPTYKTSQAESKRDSLANANDQEGRHEIMDGAKAEQVQEEVQECQSSNDGNVSPAFTTISCQLAQFPTGVSPLGPGIPPAFSAYTNPSAGPPPLARSSSVSTTSAANNNAPHLSQQSHHPHLHGQLTLSRGFSLETVSGGAGGVDPPESGRGVPMMNVPHFGSAQHLMRQESLPYARRLQTPVHQNRTGAMTTLEHRALLDDAAALDLVLKEAAFCFDGDDTHAPVVLGRGASSCVRTVTSIDHCPIPTLDVTSKAHDLLPSSEEDPEGRSTGSQKRNENDHPVSGDHHEGETGAGALHQASTVFAAKEIVACTQRQDGMQSNFDFFQRELRFLVHRTKATIEWSKQPHHLTAPEDQDEEGHQTSSRNNDDVHRSRGGGTPQSHVKVGTLECSLVRSTSSGDDDGTQHGSPLPVVPSPLARAWSPPPTNAVSNAEATERLPRSDSEVNRRPSDRDVFDDESVFQNVRGLACRSPSAQPTASTSKMTSPHRSHEVETDANLVQTVGFVPRSLGTKVLIMERMTGPLSSLPARPPEPVVLAIARQMVLGTAQMHAGLGYLHRDIKPGNFLFDATSGAVKMCDFGLACPVEYPNGVLQEFLGSQTFFAPERLRGHEFGYPADVWALGLSIACVGLGGWQHPFDAFLDGYAAGDARYWRLLELLRLDDDDLSRSMLDETHALMDHSELHAGPRTLTDAALEEAGLSEGLRAMVRRCLAQLPCDRPTSAALLQDPVWAGAASGREFVEWLGEHRT